MAEKKELDLEALKAEIKAELEAEYAARRDRDAASGRKSPEILEAMQKNEERVPIKLFKDGKEYKDDVFVAVNGENCVIRRGETVYVKRKFANVLEQAMQQQAAANEYAEGLQREYSVIQDRL